MGRRPPPAGQLAGLRTQRAGLLAARPPPARRLRHRDRPHRRGDRQRPELLLLLPFAAFTLSAATSRVPGRPAAGRGAPGAARTPRRRPLRFPSSRPLPRRLVGGRRAGPLSLPDHRRTPEHSRRASGVTAAGCSGGVSRRTPVAPVCSAPVRRRFPLPRLSSPSLAGRRVERAHADSPLRCLRHHPVHRRLSFTGLFAGASTAARPAEPAAPAAERRARRRARRFVLRRDHRHRARARGRRLPDRDAGHRDRRARDRAPAAATTPPTCCASSPASTSTASASTRPRPVIRGQRGLRVLFLEDGLRLNNARRQTDFGEITGLVDVDDVASVEVVRGPMSVLYGSDAIGGVLNLVTQPAIAPRRPALRRRRRAPLRLGRRPGRAVTPACARQSGRSRCADLGASYRDGRRLRVGAAGTLRRHHARRGRRRCYDTGVTTTASSAVFAFDLNDRRSLRPAHRRYRADETGFGFVDPTLLGGEPRTS